MTKGGTCKNDEGLPKWARSKHKIKRNSEIAEKKVHYFRFENNPNPAPSSHSILLEIEASGMRDPLMHLLFDWTGDAANLARMSGITRLRSIPQDTERLQVCG